MDRRRFLRFGALAGTLGGCRELRLAGPTPALVYPGMREGHLLRDGVAWPAPEGEIKTDVAILGSGVAGLTAAWKLAREGLHKFVVVEGPEFGGNASAGRFGELAYPRGAHYLPLPSMESVHVREMLFDAGVILEKPYAERPYFDEACVVHAPDERIFTGDRWQEGLLPTAGLAAGEAAEHKRFFAYVDLLKQARGVDGKRPFCIPAARGSRDPHWLALDTLPFRAWLIENGYTSPTLHWYLNYCCRDDYGAEYDRVSAWAGLHYFASRAGHAANADDGAVLTWPEGLHALVRKTSATVSEKYGGDSWHRPGFVVSVNETRTHVEVLCAQTSAHGLRTYVIKAKRVVCAMPLFVTARILQMERYGFDATQHMPSYAPWLVASFLLTQFPRERAGAPLAWDNVVYGGKGLGYVVATHQKIRVSPPPQTVFTAYQALSQHTPAQARAWLAQASPQALYEEAVCDLAPVYGRHLRQHLDALEITVRAHAMASPLCGSRSNRGLASLRAAQGRVLFAHSDLSGFSVFEEAAWWGYQAARKLLG